MAKVSAILRSVEGGAFGFWCPGCKFMHVVKIGDGPRPRWGFNGDYDKPTFTPSVLIRGGHYIPGHIGPSWCTYNAAHPDRPSRLGCFICHSFARDGQIQFLANSTHALAGKTVPLPPVPD